MKKKVDEKRRGNERQEDGCERENTAGQNRARKSGKAPAVHRSCRPGFHECHLGSPLQITASAQPSKARGSVLEVASVLADHPDAIEEYFIMGTEPQVRTSESDLVREMSAPQQRQVEDLF